MTRPLSKQPSAANRPRRVAPWCWCARRWRIASAIFAVCLLASCHPLRADERAEAVQAQAYALDSTNGLVATSGNAKLLGTRSCAATACHGGIQADTRFSLSHRNEYPLWLDHDPHARAQFTLSEEKSRVILQRLSREGESERDQARRLANCFGCHNPQPPAAQQSTTYYPYDGVSCEICHGAAEKWIGAHVEADWRSRKAGDHAAWRGFARDLGFVDTEDLTIRGQTCAQCHVGSPGREVNHDLIAAGHPTLKFELAAYHELLPKHWRAAEARRKDPRWEVKLWSAGQMAASEAALSLLEWRATSAADRHPDAAWPEFAEYDCFACHHDLEDPSWRRQRSLAGLPLGMPAWGTWYFGPLRLISGSADDLGPELVTLTDQMQQGFGRDRRQVQAAVSTARSQLERWRQDRDLDRIGIHMRQALARLVTEHGQPRDSNSPSTSGGQPTGWDEAVQLYLAIVALDSEAGHIDPAALRATRGLFSFPENYDSPRGFFGERQPTAAADNESPVAQPPSRRQLVAALVQFIQQLETPEN